jgi:pyrroline-5-carboxylate reductase
LTGWLAAGVPPGSVWVIEPNPTDWLKGDRRASECQGVPRPAVALLAVKPQMMGAALPALQALGNGKTLFVSIAAGTTIATFEAALGAAPPSSAPCRTPPPWSVAGSPRLCRNAHVSDADFALARDLMGAVGQVVT